ncbi:MAG TPA: hypothetical protein VF116_13300 [Ktedonobacterales bacterium]
MKIAVPLKDQRVEQTTDGRPPEDGNMDCVPTSLAAMCQALTGRLTSGDDLHDRVYGQGYVGMQDPARFAGLLDSLGVSMARVGGDAASLVARAASEIAAAHPVLLSIPSDWGDEPPHSQYAHMVAGCDVPDANSLTAMNPWGGFYQTQSRAWWAERLAHCSYSGIWVLAKKETPVATNGIPSGWHDDGATLTAPNGHHVVRGFRMYVLANSWDAANVPLEDERWIDPLSWTDPKSGAGARQIFASVALRWTQTTNVLREVLGAELLAAEQHIGAQAQQIAALQAQLKQQQGQTGQTGQAGQDTAAEQAVRALAAALATVKG